MPASREEDLAAGAADLRGPGEALEGEGLVGAVVVGR